MSSVTRILNDGKNLSTCLAHNRPWLQGLRWCERHTRNNAFNGFNGCLFRINIVGDLLAAPHNDNPVNHLKDVVNVMSDKDARVSGVSRVADETQDSLS